MNLETKSRYVEYISTLRNKLLRKIDVIDCDIKYTENPFEMEYLNNYKKFLQKEVANLSDKLKNLYVL